MKALTVFAMFLVLVGYLFMGAAVFQALESGNEPETIRSLSKISDFLANTSFTDANSSNIDQKKIEAVIIAVMEAHDEGLLETNKTAEVEKWTFMSAFCFCISVITTVGYGKIAPSTPGGQLFCIIYALLGIPVNGVLLIEVGRKLSAPIKKFRNKSTNKHFRILKSVTICTTVTSFIIFLPSFVYHTTEGWTMIEAVYYTVVTLTTIGFGDYIADYHGRGEYSDIYQLLNSLWIFVGLSWVSATVSDISDLVTARVKKDEGILRRLSRQISSQISGSSKK